jgi:hypothetical protein
MFPLIKYYGIPFSKKLNFIDCLIELNKLQPESGEDSESQNMAALLFTLEGADANYCNYFKSPILFEGTEFNHNMITEGIGSLNYQINSNRNNKCRRNLYSIYAI